MKFSKKLKSILQQFKQEITVYRLVMKDPKTPWLAKILLGAAIAYLVSPIDIIPDFIPVIGHLDDALIVPVLFYCAVKLVPQNVIDDCRKQSQKPNSEPT